MTKPRAPRGRAVAARSVVPIRSATAALRAKRQAQEDVLGKEVLEEMAKASREQLEKNP